ncbi:MULTISPECIES: PhzF family phenazine biosynthesis protein [unclassified Halomonas]|uniref:PhzF family phenazine biosynthesis protein n=1 Tax=unclassified Halomonas TaxID=2609666 RepID=UPI0007D99C4C|nr:MULTISPECIES: PhzF family phenazine biosynthesis protein [unclassified Halomonas]MBT2786183.1 PhzF family phenazine biosynthesis protein [Halomonas sp. ISL-106]MBT2797205.1 PhzF family phenazine biosynthesis protein [Halomonas sp. ISL-104]OAL58582.1 diaminopimelate epimerase [Halomonas sp. ALS9]
MKTAEYYLLDVFTDQPFTGNPLAVFLEAGGLETSTMQALANELNLAETVFVSAATGPNHYPMRIFTPTRELPFAGHPTVGTAHLLAELSLVNRAQGVVLHPPIGELAVSYNQERATFTTAQPAMLKDSTIDRITAVELLGLDIHQVVGDPVIASFGLPFHLIELTDVAALENVHISTTTWASAVVPSSAEQVYLYVIEQHDGVETVVRSRMFCMHASICEDPATGSAAAALTGYLASLQPDALQYKIHQGVEMGRPSVIRTAANGEIKPGLVTVGGNATVVGKGTLYLK